jgi:hypothetical protein
VALWLGGEAGDFMKKYMFWSVVAVGLATPAFAQSHKATVAVYQMDDVAKTGQGPTFTQMLETAITQTNKFSVIERTTWGRLSESSPRPGRAGDVRYGGQGRWI